MATPHIAKTIYFNVRSCNFDNSSIAGKWHIPDSNRINQFERKNKTEKIAHLKNT